MPCPLIQACSRWPKNACVAAGLDPPFVLTTGLEIAGAAQAVTRWAARSVTGVCAFNDETAIAVLAGMRENGLTAPTDLAVIGSDDIPTAGLTAPPSPRSPSTCTKWAADAPEAIVAGLADHRPRPGSTSAIPPRLVQRSST